MTNKLTINKKNILELKQVSKLFHIQKNQRVCAVNQVSFSVREGECLGIVGESGCGKSTLTRLITKMIPVSSGNIIFDGNDITNVNRRQRRDIYRKMQMVFQNPYSAFSPRMSIGIFIGEGLIHFGLLNKKETRNRVLFLLKQVGLSDAYYDKLPHQLSGGELQRVAIARAISISPKLLILDEPTSALDVSVQSKVLRLLQEFRHSHKLTYLFIGHDLSVVQKISDRIIVMYEGCIVEILESHSLLTHAVHPYTKKLLNSVISVHDRNRKQIEVTDIGFEHTTETKKGCPYQKRCPEVMTQCLTNSPMLKNMENDHFVACWKIHL